MRRLAQLRMGHYKLVYVAPERFRNPRFLEALSETPLSMLSIDEAHCISAWGHDFRPDYLHLGEIIATLPPSVRLLAVTATATDAVREDVVKHLCLGEGGRPEPEVIVTGFERPNLALNVTRVRTHGEKLERLLQIIEFFRTGIVYCATRKMVERVQEMLAVHGVRALAYNGAMEDEERTRVQDAFMRREAPVVVATNAFGMGVDRPDIRFVVHWDIPGSLEAYYQEVGRRNACSQGENGEATLSPEAWAERAGLKSPLAVRNLIALFERNGLLTRVRRVGSPYSTITVPKESDIPAIKRICASLAQKDATDRARLREMLDYVDARGCRHRFLLAYFGDHAPARMCTKCDVCHPVADFPPRLQPDEASLTRIRKILSCVARLHGRGNYALVAAVLRGEAESAEDRTLSTFGILKEVPAAQLVRDCEALEMDGYLTGMALTPAGYDLVLDRVPIVPIARFPEQVAKAPRRQKASASQETKSEQPSTGLATALRKWTREEGERRSLPAYMVLHNQTIAAIARKRPTTYEELALIPGMGEVKMAKYGEAILNLVSAYH